MNPAAKMHSYEVRPRKDRRGFEIVSDVLPFGRLWYGGRNAVSNAIGYAMHYSRSHDAVIRVYHAAGNVIETSTRASLKSGERSKSMPEQGTVKWFNEDKGFGLIVRERGADVFVHHASVIAEGLRTLNEGDQLRCGGGTEGSHGQERRQNFLKPLRA